MNNKKTIFLFVCAFLVIGAIIIGEINLQSLATDSGFDTSYSGGSSSGGGSSGGSSSGSFGSSSSGGGSSSGTSSPLTTIFIIIFWELGFDSLFYYALIGQFYDTKKIDNKKEKLKMFMKMRIGILGILNIILFIINYDAVAYLFFLDFLGIFVVAFTLPHLSKARVKVMSDKEIEKILPNLNREEFNFSAYQIYYNVQQAWMNFDYDSMRTLVTDELYNTYYNQLQTLSIKNEKNVMENFNLIDVKISNIKIENNIETIKVILKVSFFDYIENDKGNIIRGDKDSKVVMTYLLTFVRNASAIDICPHCGAKLSKGNSVCDYCGATIQIVGNDMKLAKKEVLKQEIKI